MFVIIAIAAALSVAIAPTMMNTAMADDPFDGKGNPHDEPGAKDGDPHIDKKTGNPHRCPGKTCDDQIKEEGPKTHTLVWSVFSLFFTMTPYILYFITNCIYASYRAVASNFTTKVQELRIYKNLHTSFIT